MTNAPIRGTLPHDRKHPVCDYADLIVGSGAQPAPSSGPTTRAEPDIDIITSPT